MELSVLGISHHTAPVEVREQVALPGELARDLLRAVHRETVLEEALILDTCNRTEIYLVPAKGGDPLGYLLDHIARLKGHPSPPDPAAFYRHHGADAVAHLFRVAAALDSQIVGEHQIVGQIKEAYRVALEERTARFLLNKLLHRALRVGKRTRSETLLGRGSTSVARAAVDLARQIFSGLAGKRALLVGAGQTAELAAKALMRCDVAHVVVANRTLARAEEVAGRLLAEPLDDAETADQDDDVDCPGVLRAKSHQDNDPAGRHNAASAPHAAPATTEAIPLGQIPRVIGEVDLVICSTGSPDLVLRADELAPAIRRSGRTLFVVDIAVPRDVDPDLAKCPNVFLYNMNDLDALVAQDLHARRLEIPRAEAIIADELGQFLHWADSLEITPTIRLLQERFARLQQAEIERYGKNFTDGDREHLEKFTNGLCKKILHSPIAFLRALSKDASTSDQLAAVDLVLRLFELDAREQDK